MVSIPKCKKLNSELILVLDFGFGPDPGNGGKCLNMAQIAKMVLCITV